ncbi:radial spoke head protein 9 homolog [Episyrphus balteatus]|uniref:radial spoke head protein 9 homolog n=1 Tax=Episyrphus balteatus TaxID=286459 RepID=UPI0024866115|nr:radial spoke head protein 9 homolog [Episyrphus balteatus]
MNIESLRDGINSLMYVGQTLTSEELLLIQNSLIILQSDNKFKEIFFWGRIQGIEKDYFIAFGYTKDCLKERKFFYSLDCLQWLMMPLPNSDLFQASLLCRPKFQGDPSHFTCVELDPNFSIDENHIILATEPEVKRLKEEDRLACAVHMITEESAVIPKGALYKMTDQSVIYNPMFHGLTELEGNLKSYYQLYRIPKNKREYNLMKRIDYNYTIDFLDTIDDAIPKDVAFQLNMERNGRLVMIRSCIWPGMTFYHKLNTKEHGFAYFGDAKKNFDLLFMI